MVRVHLDPPLPWRGALAQLGERLICIQEVIGSIPIGSTRSSQAVRSDSTFAEVLSRPTGRKLTSFRERNISIAWRSRVWGCLGFDPERRYCSKSSTLTNQRSRANQPVAWVSTAFDTWPFQAATTGKTGESLALSGSNQARKGRLVDALAARGDEGRDTLR